MAAKKTNNYITKDYLDKKLGVFKSELKEELKSDLYDIKDEIVGEIKALRDEFDAHQYSHTRINDDLENHEERLTKLEKSPAQL
jgi:hypothetical protein